ncbi:hypothetical protein DFH09DRAFT_1359130 [Mycena vulgaris]|nr:hypothetical protein DFH09DRAFT_1359130 [Mycena vulgaris]
MRNVSSPPRRKSVINVFSTPPLRRSLLSRTGGRMTLPSGDSPAPSPFRAQNQTLYPASATDSDDDSDDENMLTATGDISMSYPYYVPGALGALSPMPQSRRGTPNPRAVAPLQRPRPPARRLASVGSETYKFRTLTMKGGPTSNTPSKASSNSTTPGVTVRRAPTVIGTPAFHPGDGSVSTISSCNSSIGSIGSIEDEDPQMSTPQSRFAAFMKSRDLACSPKKSAERNQRVDALSQEVKTALGREVARPAARPLRGYAALPARMPIPNWDNL